MRPSEALALSPSPGGELGTAQATTWPLLGLLEEGFGETRAWDPWPFVSEGTCLGRHWLSFESKDIKPLLSQSNRADGTNSKPSPRLLGWAKRLVGLFGCYIPWLVAGRLCPLGDPDPANDALDNIPGVPGKGLQQAQVMP